MRNEVLQTLKSHLSRHTKIAVLYRWRSAEESKMSKVIDLMWADIIVKTHNDWSFKTHVLFFSLQHCRYQFLCRQRRSVCFVLVFFACSAIAKWSYSSSLHLSKMKHFLSAALPFMLHCDTAKLGKIKVRVYKPQQQQKNSHRPIRFINLHHPTIPPWGTYGDKDKLSTPCVLPVPPLTPPPSSSLTH